MNESERDETREHEAAGSEEPGGEVFDWQGAEDLTSLPEKSLRDRLVSLVEEERSLSYRRRVLQGRIDLIRAELVRRGGVSLSADELVQVLLGNNPGLRIRPDEDSDEDVQGEVREE